MTKYNKVFAVLYNKEDKSGNSHISTTLYKSNVSASHKLNELRNYLNQISRELGEKDLVINKSDSYMKWSEVGYLRLLGLSDYDDENPTKLNVSKDLVKISVAKNETSDTITLSSDVKSQYSLTPMVYYKDSRTEVKLTPKALYRNKEKISERTYELIEQKLRKMGIKTASRTVEVDKVEEAEKIEAARPKAIAKNSVLRGEKSPMTSENRKLRQQIQESAYKELVSHNTNVKYDTQDKKKAKAKPVKVAVRKELSDKDKKYQSAWEQLQAEWGLK